MSEMVDRVEAAVLSKIEEMFGATHCNAAGAIGKAAIEAMREPTEAMCVAGGLEFEAIAFEPDTDGAGIAFTDMGRVFTSMIAAAIAEPSA